MPEERKISPGVIILGGLGLALVGALGLATVARAAAPPLAGTILDIKWRLEGEETWHSWPMVAPANTVVEIKWTVRNDSNCDATFVAGGKINPPFPVIYTDTVTFIEQGEQGDLIASMIPYYAPTSGEVTFEVGALAGLVISTESADWQYAQVVDQITATFTLY